MKTIEAIYKAIKKINPNAEASMSGTDISAVDTITFENGTQPINKQDILDLVPECLAEIEAEEQIQQMASRKASKRAGQNNPRYFYQEEIHCYLSQTAPTRSINRLAPLKSGHIRFEDSLEGFYLLIFGFFRRFSIGSFQFQAKPPLQSLDK